MRTLTTIADTSPTNQTLAGTADIGSLLDERCCAALARDACACPMLAILSKATRAFVRFQQRWQLNLNVHSYSLPAARDELGIDIDDLANPAMVRF